MEQTLIVTCPLGHLDGTPGKICKYNSSGKRAYVSAVEHIRRFHKEHHIPGLKSTAASWQRMISSTPRPSSPPQAPRVPVTSAVRRASQVMQHGYGVAPQQVNHQAAPQVAQAFEVDSVFSENPFGNAFSLLPAAPPQRALPDNWWDLTMADVMDRFPESAFDGDSSPQCSHQAAAQDSPMRQDFIMPDSHLTSDDFVRSLPGTEVQATPSLFPEQAMPAEDMGDWHTDWLSPAERYAHPATTMAEQTSQDVEPGTVAPQQFDYQVDPEETPELIFDDATLEHGSSVEDDLPDFGDDGGFRAEELDELLSQYYSG